ncbi:ABC transporter permease [Heyndrickxia sporothermodurans]|uniref:ABC transporter permease n=1 Tax=Heyndrickxia sporothermodurans TaxID=46224 RepID=A0A150KMC7_9BACI|nr:DUF2705 family protein [Heyndrickxia sporothermodurans]KYC92345.1 hypothetical protein B4102_3736 [Heyndrickxia sporothermodurans]
MNKLLYLVKGEIYKIQKSNQLLISIMLLFIIVLSSGISNWISISKEHNWKESLKEQIEENQMLVKDLREVGNTSDLKYINELENDILKDKYSISHNINEKSSVFGFIKKNGNICFLVNIILMIFASNIMAKEERWGTIKFLLIRPYSRSKIILSKYLTVFLLAIGFYLLLIILLGIIGVIIYGFGSLRSVTLIVQDGQVLEHNLIVTVLKQYIYNFLPILAYTSLAFMISTILRSNGLAIAVSIIVSTLGGMISSAISKFNLSRYILFTNTDLNKYLSNSFSTNDMFSITVIIIYTILFLLISLLVFKKRDFI